MRTVIVIPARYGSSRLPGKPLADIHGKPMIQHVFERAVMVPGVDEVIVATDDQRVIDVVAAFGGTAVMTRKDHVSGTDRLVEVMEQVDADLYVNLQGDEPLVRPSDIALLVAGMEENQTVGVGTLCHPVSAKEALNPNCVKVVLTGAGEALYFSRAPIPYPREAETARYLKHVGVYAYQRSVLREYSQLPQSMPEQTEVLEQLRLMHAGIRIHAYEVAPTGPGVDTPECLERVRAIIAGEPEKTADSVLSGIKLIITDVDGVLTDGGLIYDDAGECHKRFHARDGLGIKMLQECGVQVAVVSGRDSPILRRRVKDLGISLCAFGVKDKAAAYTKIMDDSDARPAQTACIGDDSIDLPGFSVCGTSFAVADAAAYIKRQASYVLIKKGGEGAFREVADMVLMAAGHESVFSTHQGYATVMHGMTQ